MGNKKEFIREEDGGFFDQVEPEKVNMDNLWDTFANTHQNMESFDTTFWYGQGFPLLPNLEIFQDGTNVLFVTERQKENLDRYLGQTDILFTLPHGYFNGWGGGHIYINEIDEVFVVKEDAKNEKME